MDARPQFTLARRILFPYSGEEALTTRQALRVIVTWAALFPLGMVICALVMAILLSYSLQGMLSLLLIIVPTGVGIFGGLAVLTVVMSNRAARILQARRATKASSPPGGR